MEKMQQLLDIGTNCKDQYDSQEIGQKALAIRMLEAEKLKVTRGAKLYQYLSQEPMPSMSRVFASHYQELHKSLTK